MNAALSSLISTGIIVFGLWVIIGTLGSRSALVGRYWATSRNQTSLDRSQTGRDANQRHGAAATWARYNSDLSTTEKYVGMRRRRHDASL